MIIRELSYYDKFIFSTSGGKDSLAMILYLLENGADPSKMELWHQSIDGRYDTHKSFFDWPSTDGYVAKLAEHLNIPLSYQWREYGFYGELHRENQRTNDVRFERFGVLGHLPSSPFGQESTRLRWPAKTASLTTRWCSAYLKIDVASRALNNMPDLKGKKILFITGERREESTARSKYNESELHRTNSKSRLVHHWRAIIDQNEQWVWNIIQRHGILPHPVYYLGFPRLSCRSCIFFSKDHWATLKEVSPEVVTMLSGVEENLNFKLDNKFTINELTQMGRSLLIPENHQYVKMAVSDFSGSVTTNNWIIPTGAFGHGGGSL